MYSPRTHRILIAYSSPRTCRVLTTAHSPRTHRRALAALQVLQGAVNQDLMDRLELLADVQHSLADEVFSDVYATAAWPVRLQQVSEQARHPYM